MWLRRFSVQERAHLHIKTCCEFFDHGDGGIAGAAFEVADRGAMDAGLERELLLAQPLRGAKAPEVDGKALTDIHVAEAAAA